MATAKKTTTSVKEVYGWVTSDGEIGTEYFPSVKEAEADALVELEYDGTEFSVWKLVKKAKVRLTVEEVKYWHR